MIKVFIVDDHKMVIEGLMLLLQNQQDINVVGFALSGEEALKQIKVIRPDVILMDINMPGLNGIETTKRLLSIDPKAKIIAISMHKETSLIKLMVSQGAKGYVLKNAGQQEVIEAITSIHSGKRYFDETVNEIIINSVTNQSSEKENQVIPKLSRREKEVLRLIMDECTTQEIAEKLFISFGTVETHRRNMLIKTGARNTVGLVKMALDFDLLN
jgi:DNA-binding NarL/FixJ family response regulator